MPQIGLDLRHTFKRARFQNVQIFSSQVNHMEELTPSKEMDTVIKSAVLLRY